MSLAFFVAFFGGMLGIMAGNFVVCGGVQTFLLFTAITVLPKTAQTNGWSKLAKQCFHQEA